jgi:lipid-A-disaccharide synthase
VYKTSWINIVLASLLMRTRYVGLVNILARRPAALELLQTEVTAENIAGEAVRLLEDDAYRRGIIAELEYIKKSLGSGNPAEKAARAIALFVRSPS